MLRILLVEDHAAFRGALARLLNRQPDLEVTSQCGSLADRERGIQSPGADGLLDKSRPFAEIAAEVRRLGEGDF